MWDSYSYLLIGHATTISSRGKSCSSAACLVALRQDDAHFLLLEELTAPMSESEQRRTEALQHSLGIPRGAQWDNAQQRALPRSQQQSASRCGSGKLNPAAGPPATAVQARMDRLLVA